MAAAATDKFTKVGSPGTATTLDSPGHTIGGTSITVISTSNWPTSTGVIFAMDTVTLVDGVEVRDVGSYTEWEGVVASATSITGLVLREGSDQNYPAGSTTRVYIPVAGSQNDRMVDGLLVEHNQDGTHSAITATSITATTGTFTNFTITGTASSEGWSPLGATPNTITANGNRSYDIVFNSVDKTSTVSPGMRLKLTRTVTAPTQCTDLEAGSSQYYSKTSPSGLSFTDDFTVSAWIKPESYTGGGIIARRNADTEGWSFAFNSNGTLEVAALRIAGNNSVTTSYQSLPLNKWSHVAATVDLSGTSVLMYIDGVLVPSTTTVTGTCTALVQGTTALVVGAYKSAGTAPFDGKIAQASVHSAVLSAATIKAMMNQTLDASANSIVSGYTFNNTINDVTANANNLTAQGSAVATNADTPFTQDVTGTSVTAGTTNYAIVTKASFSTNTTLTVQVPEGDTIPTSGGVSAVSYSTQKVPYGFPSQRGKWEISSILRSTTAQTPSPSTWYNVGSHQLSLPTGEWQLTRQHSPYASATGGVDAYFTLSTGAATESNNEFTTERYFASSVNSGQGEYRSRPVSTTTTTVYYLNMRGDAGTSPSLQPATTTNTPAIINAELAYL